MIIYSISHSMNLPWIVSGDSNAILFDEEMIWGLLVTYSEVEDFTFWVNSGDLVDIKFKGSSFTW